MLEIFRHQAKYNPVYKQFVEQLGVSADKIEKIEQIPFLPIDCFKWHTVKTGEWQEQMVFTSSGTTAQNPSRHYIRQPESYLENAVRGFEAFYGNLSDWVILALLPSYLERQGSSLVFMLQYFIQKAQPESGFYLYNTKEMLRTLATAKEKGKKVLVWGVSYALLDLAEQYAGLDWSEGVLLMETGGMKGQRQEIPRQTMHEQLCAAFNLPAIHSEYGMTELLSQAYSQGNGIFRPSDTLKILIRDSTDPFCLLPAGKTGCINIIDLANTDSCAFIATDDLGKINADGTFEVLGRLDSRELRGCNLLLEGS